MAQHDYVIANGTGAAVRSDLNNALAAIVSQNSGATAPSTTYAYQWWADTTTGLLKLRNAANNAWITLFQLDGEWSTLAVENGSAAAPSIYFKDSGTDTGVYSPGADQVAISTGGTVRLSLSTTAVSSALAIDHPLGAVGTPSITFTGDLNTGIYSPAADTLAFVEGGVEAMRIDSSGRVGIGTTNPTSALHIDVASGEPFRFRSRTSGANYFAHVNHAGGDLAYVGAGGGAALGSGTTSDYAICANQGALLFGTNGNNERARIDSSGRFLVGTSTARSNVYYTTAATTPSVQFESVGSVYNGLSLINYSASGFSPVLTFGLSASNTQGNNAAVGNAFELGTINFTGNDGTNFRTGASIIAVNDQPSSWAVGDCPTRIMFSTTADGASSPTERMRITSDGLTWWQSGGHGHFVQTLQGAGTTFAFFNGRHTASGSINTGTSSYWVWTNGNVQNTNGSYTAISDVKLKENIVDASSQWDDLKAIRICNWNFKEETGHETHRQIGPIAQELEQVCPGLVFETPDRDAEGNETGEVTKGVNQSVLYMKAVKALQEAMERIEQLESEMAAVKAQLS